MSPNSVAKPERPAYLAHGRWLADFEPLSAFERKLVTTCARGEVCEPENWDGNRPAVDASTEVNTIRAEIIRFLALGGDSGHPVHEEGVMLHGGWVSGKLNLHSVQTCARLNLQRCNFEKVLELKAANISELVLIGSKVPGLSADRMKTKGSVFLREQFCATGKVSLSGAHIGGNLELKNGHFCRDMLPEHNDKIALNAENLIVVGTILMTDSNFDGYICLTSAHAGSLTDKGKYWSKNGIILSGFYYNRISDAPTDATTRIEWLKNQRISHLFEEFRPQPWEQLIKTLREMGYPYEASKVAIAKQDQWRNASRLVIKEKKFPVAKNNFISLKNSIGRRLRFGLHWLYGVIAGYGHRPIWTAYWMAAVCMFCSIAFYGGRELGVVGPSSPLIHANARFDDCGTRGEAGKYYWTSTNCPMPPEYTTFQPFFYSLDLILPLVDLQQDSDWAPIVSNSKGEILWPGRFLRWLMWFEIVFGWMASLTLVAVLGRLVDKD